MPKWWRVNWFVVELLAFGAFAIALVLGLIALLVRVLP